MKFKDYKNLMFNLRMFDDPDPADEGGNDQKEEPDKKEEEKPDGKKYDDAEVDRIVAKHKAEWEKKHAEDLKKATDEARKYERMTKEQKEAEDKRKAVTPMNGKDCECFVHSSFFVDFCGVVRNNNNNQQLVVYNPVRFCGKFRLELHLLSVGSMKLDYKRKRGSYYEAWNPWYGHDRQGHADRHP